MMRWIQRLFSAVLVAFALVLGAARAEAIELVVQYTQPQFFDGAFAKLKKEFEAQNSGITIKYRGPLPNYGAGIQALLRESTIGEMPHVDYVGLGHIPTVAHRGLAVDLAP